MKPLGLLGFWRLCHFSQPAHDRVLYKLVARHRPKSLVEGGLVSLHRSASLIRVAQRVSANCDISYLGLDEFEGRAKPVAELTLRQAHKCLHRTGAKTRILPGDPIGTLVRTANQIGKADLFLLSVCPEIHDLDQLWFFLPRMMHEHSVVLLRRDTQQFAKPEVLTLKEIQSLADSQRTAGKAA